MYNLFKEWVGIYTPPDEVPYRWGVGIYSSTEGGEGINFPTEGGVGI